MAAANKSQPFKSLKLKLVATILLVSAFFTLITTGIQVHQEYERDLTLIEERITSIESSHLPALIISVWSLDTELILTQLESLTTLPDVHSVKLITEFGDTYSFGPEDNGQNLRSFNAQLITKGDDPLLLGQLTINSDLNIVYQRAIDRIVMILLSEMIKTFFVSIAIIMVIQWLVIQHLSQIKNYIDKIRLNQLSTPLTLHRQRHLYQDELDTIAGSINQMRENFQQDVKTQKQQQEIIWHQANFDQLTQLPNRQMVNELLEQQIRKSQRDDGQIWLMFMDLDGFKAINDNFGHPVGDQLLQDVAVRLQESVRSSDVVGRLSGDEFIIMLSGINQRDQVDYFASRVINNISKPYPVNGTTSTVTASLGIAHYPDDADNSKDLMRLADQSMYAAKNQGKNRFIHYAEIANAPH